jgi:L-malate glycosyltransferase
MRIAFISTIKNAAWGGSEELWYQSAEKAIEAGHELGIFVYWWPEEPSKLSLLRKKGAKIYKRTRTVSRAQRLLRKTLELTSLDSILLNPYRHVVHFKPDRIVITDGATFYTANDKWLTIVLEKFKGKYIIISQGNGSYSFPDSRIGALSLFNNAQKIIFVSENNRKQAFHQLAKQFTNTGLIQNPVNLFSYDPLESTGSDNGTIHFAMIGRLAVSEKGQDIVIAIIAEEYWRKSNVKIHIYGTGKDLQYLKDLADYYGVSDKIIFEGHIAIEKIWRQCQALLMPSISEGTPLTLLEAMVLGKLCIATDVGGNGEWILDGENGFLAEAPTQELFSKKMKEAVISKEQWPEISARAHLDTLRKLDFHPGETLLKEIVGTA